MSDLDDLINEHTRKKVRERIALAEDDLIFLGVIEANFPFADDLPKTILDAMEGNEEKFFFYASRGYWRPFVHTERSGRKWLALLRLHGRCLNRYVQADGYCPDCHKKHALPAHEETSKVYHKKTRDEYIAWWKEHNPYMLDKAPDYKSKDEITPGRYGDLADYSELDEENK